MQYMKQFIFVAIALASLVSCTKTINVDLKNADSRLVIEGVIDNVSRAEVSISKSVTFSSSNTFPGVSGATVVVTDNAGNTYTLTETTTGKYTNPGLTGVPGRTYVLNVNVDGGSYSATSTMPQVVPLDTVLTERLVFGAEAIVTIKPQYKDPAGFGNYYKFYKKINGVLFPSYWVFDDRLNDNGISTRPMIQIDSTIEVNDIVEVEMQCIDKNTARYFQSLLDVQQGSTVPANPDTNFSGGCLGYFSAQTSQRKSVVVR